MVIKQDAEGYILDSAGARETDEAGQPIKGFTQKRFDETLGSRLSEQKTKLEQAYKGQIAGLEAQIATAPSAEEANRLKKQLTDLEEKVLSADQISERRAAEARREAEQRASESDQRATHYEARWKTTLYENEVIAEAGSRQRGAFNDSQDLIAALNPYKMIEDVKDDSGKPTGDIRIRYKMVVPDKDDPTKTKEKILTTTEAANVIRSQKPYLLRGSNVGGSGNRNEYTELPAGEVDLSKLSAQEKISHGYRLNEQARRGR